MAWTKLKTTVLVGAIAIMAAGTATTVTICRAKTTAGAATGQAKPSPFAFAGYATPEASVKSMLWAGSMGDFEKFLAACTPEQVERFRNKMAGKADEEIRRAAIAWAKALTDYKITQKETISEDEVHLHIHATPSAEGLHDGKVVVIMKKIGNEWKQEGDL